MPTDENALVAYHEAGHAVASHLLRIGFRTVSIVPRPEDESAGRCELSITAGKMTPNRAQRLIMVHWAGTIAETYASLGWEADDYTVLTGHRNRGHLDIDFNAGSDMDRIKELLRSLTCTDEEAHALDNLLRLRARDLLLRPCHWAAVEALATELMRCSELSGRRAHAVIREAIGRHQSELSAQQSPSGVGLLLQEPGRSTDLARQLVEFKCGMSELSHELLRLDPALPLLEYMREVHSEAERFLEGWHYPLAKTLRANTRLADDACVSVAFEVLKSVRIASAALWLHCLVRPAGPFGCSRSQDVLKALRSCGSDDGWSLGLRPAAGSDATYEELVTLDATDALLGPLAEAMDAEPQPKAA